MLRCNSLTSKDTKLEFFGQVRSFVRRDRYARFSVAAPRANRLILCAASDTTASPFSDNSDACSSRSSTRLFEFFERAPDDPGCTLRVALTGCRRHSADLEMEAFVN